MTDSQPVAGAHLNVNCLDVMQAKPRLTYTWLRFDSNDDCNLHCVYCHNSRSKGEFDLQVFRDFLRDKVERLENFQFGCRMEPTLDPRLVEFIEALHDAPVRPTGRVVLQTNATLLNRHDAKRMQRAGLTDLHLSVDTIDPEVFAELRGGAKVERIIRNMNSFRSQCPEVTLRFIVTVARANRDHIAALIDYAHSLGVKAVVLREVFHAPGGKTVDDAKMAQLVLPEGDFAALAREMEDRFGGRIHLNYTDASGLRVHSGNVRAFSY